MTIDGDDDTLGRQAQLAAHAFDDPDIRLMGHKPVDLVVGEAVRGEGLLDTLREALDRVTKDVPAVHAKLAGKQQPRAVGHANAAVDV